MENLFKIKGLFTIIIFAFATFNLFSQNDLFVFEVSGMPHIVVKDSIHPISKGTIIDKKTTLVMGRNDTLIFINDQGDTFELYGTGEFSHKELKKIPAIKDNSSFTRNFFAYIWKEFMNNVDSRNNKSGVVYRGDDDMMMQHPPDSSEVFTTELAFSWKPVENKEKNYYFFLKELDTEHVLSIGTPSTTISMLVDGDYIKHGKTYNWAVSETRFPNFRKMTFYTFNTAPKEGFKARKDEISAISTDLKKMGIDSSHARHLICMDYKVCY